MMEGWFPEETSSAKELCNVPLLETENRMRYLPRQDRNTHEFSVIAIEKTEDQTSSPGPKAPQKRKNFYRLRQSYNSAITGSTIRVLSHEILTEAFNGNLENVKKIVQRTSGSCIDVCDDVLGDTPLLIAAERSHCEVFQYLLDQGACVNKQDQNGFTPLHHIASHVCQQCTAKLFDHKHGVEVCVTTSTGYGSLLPLHIAALEGNYDVCQRIYKHFDNAPDVRNKKTGMLPIHYAAKGGNVKVLKFLVEETHANISSMDKNKYTALHWASAVGSLDCCRYLLDKHQDRNLALKSVTKQKETPLILAAQKGHALCCNVLSLSDLEMKDLLGNTALHYAVAGGYSDSVRILLQMKSDIQSIISMQNRNGDSPYHLAARLKRPNVFNLLLPFPMSPTQGNKSGRNLLHEAAMKNSQETLQYLLQEAELKTPTVINQIDSKDSNSPLLLAIKQLASECAIMLIRAGADKNLRDKDGNSPLHLAVYFKLVDVFNELLNGDDTKVDIQNKDKATALHVACLGGDPKFCYQLIQKGASIDKLDKNRLTPPYVAVLCGHTDVLVYFLKNVGLKPNNKLHWCKSNLLHFSAEKGHTEICRILLKKAPETAFTVNYRHKKPLDLALENDQFQTYSFLISHIPNDKEKQDFQDMVHQHLRFCINHDLRKYQEVILASEWWLEALWNRNTGDYLNYSFLLEKNPGLACTVLDKFVTRTLGGIQYDFRLYENSSDVMQGIKGPHPKHAHDRVYCEEPNGATYEYDMHPLLKASELCLLDVLKHPLTTKWIEKKWNTYVCKIVFCRMLAELFAVLCLSMYLCFALKWDEFKSNNEDNVALEDYCNGIHSNSTSISEETVPVRHIFFGLCCIGTALLFLWEIFLWCKSSLVWRASLLRHFRLVGLIVTCATIDIPLLQPCYIGVMYREQWLVGIVTILVFCLNFIDDLNKIPWISVFIPPSSKFWKMFMKISFYFFFILTAFAFVFYLLLKPNPGFNSFPVSFVKTVVWMLGDLGYDDTFLSEEIPLPYPVMTNIMFVIFVTVISSFIINLIIAQPNDMLDKYREKAELFACINMVHIIFFHGKLFLSLNLRYKVEYLITKENFLLPFVSSRRGLYLKDSVTSIIEDKDDEDMSVEESLQKIKTLTEKIQLKLKSPQVDVL